MDTRYQIEEMISQDGQGVVFQGTDAVTGVVVAMRRFIDTGGKHSEISECKDDVFGEAVAKLQSVKHPSLRRLLAGGCDPVDQMPYLITRWCDGVPATDLLLSGNALPPGWVRQILGQFIDANETIKRELGREGLWLETHPGSVFLRPVVREGDCPSAVFWLCPWQWLRDRESDGELMALPDLAESLLGGRREATKGGAANPFAKWIEMIRNHQIKTAVEAKAALAEMDLPDVNVGPVGEEPDDGADGSAAADAPDTPDDGNEDPTSVFDSPGLRIAPAPKTARADAVLPGLPESPKSGKKKIIAIAAVLIALVGFLSWAVMDRPEADDDMMAELADEDGPAGNPDATGAIALAIPGDLNAAEERRQHVLRRGYYTIHEGDLLAGLVDQEVTFRGRLANLRESSSGLTLYLEFSENAPREEPCVYLMMTRKQEHGLGIGDLEPMVGRMLEIRGTVDLESSGSTARPRIQLVDRSRLELLAFDDEYELR